MKPRSWALALAILMGASALGLSWAALPALSSGPATATPVPAAWPAGEMSTAAISGCPMFPADNVWNTPVDSLPVDLNSDAYINSIGPSTNLHADFGANWNGGPFGIPYITVPGNQPRVAITFGYAGESDPGPYPIPTAAPIEGGPDSDGDRHVLVVDRTNCVLYEMYDSWPNSNGTWHAGSGAVYTLTSNALRPDGWTSADAAGLPILPGLVRYDEVKAGAINHAIRFTAQHTQRDYIWPARHYASTITSTLVPPMGQRFRLKATFPISGPADLQVILTAMKTYGLILADNGSNWYISGVPDARWDDDVLNLLKKIPGSNFEAVDESCLMVNINSGQVATAPVDDLRVAQAVTGSGRLTATLRWTPPASAMTTTVRYSTTLITAGNWASAPVITDTLPGGTGVLTAGMSFISDGTAYFALEFQIACGPWSPLSNIAFWPSQDVYLPIILRN
jgi:hypothetical protein